MASLVDLFEEDEMHNNLVPVHLCGRTCVEGYVSALHGLKTLV